MAPCRRTVPDPNTLDRPLAGLSRDEALRLARLSLEIGPDCVYWVDMTADVVYANDPACRTLGYSREEFARMTVADIGPIDPEEADAHGATKEGNNGAPRTYETVHRHKEGRLIPVRVTATPVVIGDRRFVAAVVRDISSRRGMAAEEALCRAKESPPPPGPMSASEPEPEKAGPTSGIEADAPPRVLVVDDNRLNQHVARQMLGRLGIVVEIANNGREAVEAMRRGPDRFDAILMDLQMPEMDGPEATRVIRKEFPHRAVPIIAATANALPSEKVACLDAGMSDYVSKPIDAKQLESALARWVKLPSTAGEPVPAPSNRLPQVPFPAQAPIRGVDVGSALARLNGKHDLLVRLLREFVDEHKTAAATIAAAIAQDDFDAALRMIHTLKGVAGTLSANAVYEAARALEVSVRQGHRESLPAHVERLGAALDVVCRSVAGWAGDIGAAAVQTERRASAPSASATVLAEFDRLLKNRRFSARTQFGLVKEHASAPELKGRLDEIQDCLDRLDFQQARDLLPAVATALGVSLARG